MKTCTKCGDAKPLNEFYRDPRVSDGRRSDCRDCAKARQLQYRAYPEVIAARKRYKLAYNADPANRAAKVESSRRRQSADPVGYRAYLKAHRRVTRLHGPARKYPCTAPGCPEQAYSWALDCDHPSVARVPYGLYSDETAAYRPMCMSCNKREDAQRRREEAATEATCE